MTLKSHYSQEKLGQKGQWFTLMESASQNADVRSDIQDAPFAEGLMLEIIVSSASTLSVTPTLETVDDSGNVMAIWTAAAAVTADGTVIYVFYPGAAADLDGITEDADTPLPRQWNLFIDFGTGSATIEVHACYLG